MFVAVMPNNKQPHDLRDYKRHLVFFLMSL